MRLLAHDVLIPVDNQGLGFIEICGLMVGKHALKILR